MMVTILVAEALEEFVKTRLPNGKLVPTKTLVIDQIKFVADKTKLFPDMLISWAPPCGLDSWMEKVSSPSTMESSLIGMVMVWTDELTGKFNVPFVGT